MKNRRNSERNHAGRFALVFLVAVVPLMLIVTEAWAGRLRSGLIEISNNLRQVEKQVKEAAENFDKISSNAWQLMQMTAGGVDETYLYINQKIKARGEKYEDHLKATVGDFADKNVKAFVKGISDGGRQAAKFSREWSDVGDGLKTELAKLDGSLDDIEKMIAKKKKKWFKSKKYKNKLKTYEKALDELRNKSRSILATLKEAQADKPPSPRQIKANLDIGPKSTLAELENLAAHSVKQMLKEYSENKKGTEGRKRKFREAGDFGAELNILKEWAKEADAMDK